MAYFEDLTPCYYHRGPCDADQWTSPLLAIGWLEHPHPFPKGLVDPKLIEKFETIIDQTKELFSHRTFRGLHECDFCGYLDASNCRSCANAWIPGERKVYLAPGLLPHYIRQHQYHPPSEFLEALSHCPDPRSDEYLKVLRESNDGSTIPLETAGYFWFESRAMHSLLHSENREDAWIEKGEPAIADTGAVVQVTPGDDVQMLFAKGKHQFLEDRSPFSIRVEDRIEDTEGVVAVRGEVIDGHERYLGLKATLFVRLDGSDWLEDNRSAAGFRIGKSYAMPTGEYPFTHPLGSMIEEFPHFMRYGSIDSRIGDEPERNSAKPG